MAEGIMELTSVPGPPPVPLEVERISPHPTRWSAGHVAALAHVCADGNRHKVWRFVQGLLDGGMPAELVLFSFLPAAAKQLDADVAADRSSDAARTVAQCQLRSLALRLHECAAPFDVRDRRAVFLELTSGSLDVESLLYALQLEQQGWRVDELQGLDMRGVLAHVRESRPHVVLCSAFTRKTALELAWFARTTVWTQPPGAEVPPVRTRWLACGRGFRGRSNWPMPVVDSQAGLLNLVH